jgi:UDP-N-acetylmuramyl pentapeptide phosphotransferase/UDP-N-acetylglucosamine-1-phosphate transferase
MPPGCYKFGGTGERPHPQELDMTIDPSTLPVAASACASFAIAALLVLTAGSHGRFTMDSPGAIQKFHCAPTPRVGGVGIYFALLCATSLVRDHQAMQILNTILIAGIPALTMGLLEDLTKRVGVRARLLATVGSGCLASLVSGVALNDLDIPVLDQILRVAPLALAFTGFAVGGLANAINIIDGFHGLASGTVTICLVALAAIAAVAGDTSLALVAVLVAAAVAGFWLVNFPWGKLFLGDGGAYFAGFALAWLAVLLPARNPSVSPWASFLVCAYPVIEVAYSVARRYRKRQSAGEPDRQHLHSLVATQLILPRMSRLAPHLQNSAVSVVMWACAATPALFALALYRRTDLLMICSAACVVAYHLIYRRITRP